MASDSEHAATARWFEARLPVWQTLVKRLAQLENRGPVPPQTVRQAMHAYPELAGDLAVARRQAPNGRLTRYLASTYLRLHRVIFRSPRALGEDLRTLFLVEVPYLVGQLKWRIFSVTLLFHWVRRCGMVASRDLSRTGVVVRFGRDDRKCPPGCVCGPMGC